MINEDLCKPRCRKVPTIQTTEGNRNINDDRRELKRQNQAFFENHT